MADDPSAKPYLEYLDKEMSIMGILSTFAVAVPTFALTQLMGAAEGTRLSTMWLFNKDVFVVGSVVSFLSALAFYRQRSALAYWYGQISISISPAPRLSDGGSPTNCIEAANSWSTWRSYMAAFYLLYLSLFLFALGFLKKEVLLSSWYVIAAGAVTALAGSLSWHWRQRFAGNERPEPRWYTDWKKAVRKKVGLPAG